MRLSPDRTPALDRSPLALLRGLLLVVAALVWVGPAVEAAAQPAAFPGEPSAASTDLALLLRGLGDDRRVLMIAAHPDDEDTALLAHLALGMGARTAYLSLTRGEGGQNLIGPEMDEGLGLVRTGELLAARRLDGATQYFSRAFDFGFSRTADETFEHWPREVLLEDVVRLVRTLRPQVIVSVFHGTARDGHGHHQASGILAKEAFEAAADRERFPHLEEEGLFPWAPTKLYHLLWREPEGVELRVQTGVLDPLLGRSHFQVAMAGRSRHRSQDMGVAEAPGPWASRLALAASRGFGTDDPEAPLFAGIATGLLEMAELAGGGMEISRRLQEYEEVLGRVRERLHPERPQTVLSELVTLRQTLAGALEEAERSLGVASDLETRVGWGAVVDALRFREAGLAEAILLAAGVVVEARVDRPLLVPGEEVRVEALVWNGGEAGVAVEGVEVQVPRGWGEPRAAETPAAAGPPSPVGVGAAPAPLPGAVGAGALGAAPFVVGVPDRATPSVLHFLRLPREGSLYAWPAEDPDRGTGSDAPPLLARVTLQVAGASLQVERAVGHVSVDKALGQERTPVHVAPRVSLALERGSMAWPLHDEAPRSVRLRVSNPGVEGVEGEVRLEGPEGWEVRPTAHPLSLPGETETEFVFEIRPGEAGAGSAASFAPADEAPSDPGTRAAGVDPGSGTVTFRALAEVDGIRHGDHFTRVDYPHIDPLPLLTPAELHVHRFAVQVRPGIRVGYVMGPGDGGFDALRDLGVEVRLLDEADLLGGDLSGLDVVVLGARAYETRTDLARATPRLLEWTRAGGTLVAQYNKYEYPEGDFGPFPLRMNRPHDRITDPEATVTFLEPDHPLVVTPNPLSDHDFEGWIQERGLYFLAGWDGPFLPLVEMADPGMEPVRGGWVVAPVGEGAYIYTGLALFRQWPRGVPGAFRILANLVSLEGGEPAFVEAHGGR